MKTNSKKANERVSKKDKRPYQVGYGADCDFAVLLGEDSIEFEILYGELAEEHAPDGPLEEDQVLTLAKCIWRKRRYQRFQFARAMSAHFNPKHEGYLEESNGLERFLHAIDGAKSFEEIQLSLDQLEKEFVDYLNFECPRTNFRAPEEWVKAIQKNVTQTLMPWFNLIRIKKSSDVFTDDVIARELELEERIDRTIEQTLDRLEKVKAAKRRVSFREAQRFDRSHSGRLVRFVK